MSRIDSDVPGQASLDSDVPGQASLDYEAWRDLVRTMGGRFNPEGVDPTTFTGWVRPLNVCDFIAAEVGSNAPRLERTNRDVRLDGVDQYFTVFQLAGRSGMTHNDEAMRVEVGDVVLVDVARPATFVAEDQGEPWNCITLSLPRQSLVPTWDSSRVVVSAGAVGQPQGGCSSTLSGAASEMKDQHLHPPIPICGSRSTILSAHCLPQQRSLAPEQRLRGCSVTARSTSMRPGAPPGIPLVVEPAKYFPLPKAWLRNRGHDPSRFVAFHFPDAARGALKNWISAV